MLFLVLICCLLIVSLAAGVYYLYRRCAKYSFEPLTLRPPTKPRKSAWRRFADMCLFHVWKQLYSVFYRSELALYNQLKDSGKLIPFDFEDTFYRFYMTESQRPLKLKFLTRREYFLSHIDSDFARLLKRVNKVNSKFEFKDMAVDMLIRFIELLEPATLYQFSKTSKSIYSNCLDVRGLEYSVFKIRDFMLKPNVACTQDGCHCLKRLAGFNKRHTILDLTCGRFSGFFQHLLQRQPDWIRFVVCQNVLDYTFDPNALNFLQFQRRYSHLILTFDNRHFAANYRPVLDEFIHPNVRNVKLVILSNKPNHRIRLLDLLTFLDKCVHVGQISFFLDSERGSIRSTERTMDCDVHFQDIKASVEAYAESRPGLEHFELMYKRNMFFLHRNKLHHVRELLHKKYFLVEHYNVELPFHLIHFEFGRLNHPLYRLEHQQRPLDYRVQWDRSGGCQGLHRNPEYEPVPIFEA